MTSHHAWQPADFTIMGKPRGPICNLDCLRCDHLSKEKTFIGSE